MCKTLGRMARLQLIEELSWLRKVDSVLGRKIKTLKQPTKLTLELIKNDYLAVAIDGITQWNELKSSISKT